MTRLKILILENLQDMWRRLKNAFLSFKTYNALSPDLKARRRVNRWLSHRPALKLEQWFECWPPRSITWAAATFAYSHLERYSGLNFAQVLPDDRLEENLNWTQVCWYDWELRLCDDFWRCFQIDLSEHLDEFDPATIAELVDFLNRQILEQRLYWLDDPYQNLDAEEINW